MKIRQNYLTYLINSFDIYLIKFSIILKTSSVVNNAAGQYFSINRVFCVNNDNKY